MGARQLLWRLERLPAAREPATGFHHAGVPWFRLDADGRILEANPAGAALAAGRPDPEGFARRLLGDPPLRPDGVHILAGSGQAARAVVIPDADGRRDLLLMPLNGAEISGLVPDHFLEELPVALARLETDGRLTYANLAARQLLGARARPGANVTELIEGLGRPIAERLADTTRGRAFGRSEVARGTADGQEVFLQVAFTRTVLDGAPSLLAVLSDATEQKSLEAQFAQSPEDAGGRPARRRRRPRLQQPADRDDRLLRSAAAAPRPGDQSHGDIMQIKQNANRAANLVRQLLAFSRQQTLQPRVLEHHRRAGRAVAPAAPADRREHRAEDRSTAATSAWSRWTRGSSSRSSSIWRSMRATRCPAAATPDHPAPATYRPTSRPGASTR